ncbi:MAG: hypothetical protein WKF58_18690 [Ilumatobacteraceae bacterium]
MRTASSFSRCSSTSFSRSTSSSAVSRSDGLLALDVVELGSLAFDLGVEVVELTLRFLVGVEVLGRPIQRDRAVEGGLRPLVALAGPGEQRDAPTADARELVDGDLVGTPFESADLDDELLASILQALRLHLEAVELGFGVEVRLGGVVGALLCFLDLASGARRDLRGALLRSRQSAGRRRTARRQRWRSLVATFARRPAYRGAARGQRASASACEICDERTSDIRRTRRGVPRVTDLRTLVRRPPNVTIT